MASSPSIEHYDPKTAKLLSFSEAIPAFRDGSDTPRAYLERCIETIESREPEVKAFVTLNFENARKAADASTDRYKQGRALSELDGLPVAIKDVHETEDMPMQVGSPIFEGWSSGWDGACVFWLRKLGAAIIGKTVTTEFAFSTPGPARNPWDTARTPGGSSSGSGAAIGARMVPVATGSQVRGSILRPPAYCGRLYAEGVLWRDKLTRRFSLCAESDSRRLHYRHPRRHVDHIAHHLACRGW